MKTRIKNDNIDDRINPPADCNGPGGKTMCNHKRTVKGRTAQCKHKTSKLKVKRALRYHKSQRRTFKKNNNDIM